MVLSLRPGSTVHCIHGFFPLHKSLSKAWPKIWPKIDRKIVRLIDRTLSEKYVEHLNKTFPGKNGTCKQTSQIQDEFSVHSNYSS